MSRMDFFFKANGLTVAIAGTLGFILGLAELWGENPVLYAWIFAPIVAAVITGVVSLITSAVLIAIKRLNLWLHLSISLGGLALFICWTIVGQ